MGALRSAAKGPSRSERPGHRRAGHHKRLLRDKGSETAQAWFLCNNVIYSLPNRVQASHNNNKKIEIAISNICIHQMYFAENNLFFSFQADTERVMQG